MSHFAGCKAQGKGSTRRKVEGTRCDFLNTHSNIVGDAFRPIKKVIIQFISS